MSWVNDIIGVSIYDGGVFLKRSDKLNLVGFTVTYDSVNDRVQIVGAGGGGTPGGSSGQLQFNNGGAFSGVTGSVVSGATVALTGLFQVVLTSTAVAAALVNSTAATAGTTVQSSPSLQLVGHGWNGSASEKFAWTHVVEPLAVTERSKLVTYVDLDDGGAQEAYSIEIQGAPPTYYKLRAYGTHDLLECYQSDGSYLVVGATVTETQIRSTSTIEVLAGGVLAVRYHNNVIRTQLPEEFYNTVTFHDADVSFHASVANPTLKHGAISSGTGDDFVIAAQAVNGTAASAFIGGKLVIGGGGSTNAGTGTATGGGVDIVGGTGDDGDGTVRVLSGATVVASLGKAAGDYVALGDNPSASGALRLSNNTSLSFYHTDGDVRAVFVATNGNMHIGHTTGGNENVYIDTPSGRSVYFRPGGGTSVVFTESSIYFGSAVASPIVYQQSVGDATGQILRLAAQGNNSATLAAGYLDLIGGNNTGAGAKGAVRIKDPTNTTTLAQFNGTTNDFVALGPTPAASGALRFGQSDGIKYRNVAGSGDYTAFQVSSGNVFFGSASAEGDLYFDTKTAGYFNLRFGGAIRVRFNTNGTTLYSNLLGFDAAASAPQFYQVAAGDATGQTFSIYAQANNSATLTAGNLDFRAGNNTHASGATLRGSVRIRNPQNTATILEATNDGTNDVCGVFGALTSQAAVLAPLTLPGHSGTPNTTLVAVSGTGDDTTINDNLHELGLRVNELYYQLENFGLFASS